MRSVPGWPTDRTVAEPSSRAVVGGRERHVESVSISRSFSDGVDGSGSGISAATADLTVVETDADVFQRRRTPWSAAAAQRGQTVSVDMGYGDATTRTFTGVVDGSSGSVAASTKLEAVDPYARLDREITWDPMMATMYPFADGMAYRYIGLTPTYVTQRLLREAGFYATPQFRFGAVVSAPLNGSTWPESGLLRESYRDGAATSRPEFEESWWGQSTFNVIARYEPEDFAGISGRDFEMQTLIGNGGSSANSTIVAFWGSQWIRLLVRTNKSVELSIDTGSFTNVVTLSAAEMSGARMVTARVTRAGVWSLVADNGASASASRSFPFTSNFSQLQVHVPRFGTRLGGVQAGWMDAGPTTFTPTANLTPSAFPHTLEAMPALVQERVADLLDAQANAELAAYWIDADGVLQWRNRFHLAVGDPVRTITSTDDLLDLSWKSASARTTESIKVQGKRPINSVSERATITVYQNSAETLDSGQVYSNFYSPETDVDWVAPNTRLDWLTASAEDVGGYHRGRRSWVGMTVVSQSGVDPNAEAVGIPDAKPEEWVSRGDQFLEKIDPRTFVWSFTAPTVGADEQIEMRSRLTDPAIFPQWRGVDLPILRAYGKIMWVDQSITRTGEPTGMQEHTHDVAWYVQHGTAIEGIADALQQRLLDPKPAIDDVPIVPDPRLELGDIVRLVDSHITGIDLRCLITVISLTGEPGSLSMTVGLRILTVNGVEATYEELEEVWTSGQYSGLESEWDSSNYTAFENEPLRRT